MAHLEWDGAAQLAVLNFLSREVLSDNANDPPRVQLLLLSPRLQLRCASLLCTSAYLKYFIVRGQHLGSLLREDGGAETVDDVPEAVASSHEGHVEVFVEAVSGLDPA